MAKKKKPFNNKKITRMLKKYVSSKRKSRKLRDEIARAALPLIDAALSKQGMYRNKEDIRQECALKVLQAIPKFKTKRGDAFGFFWATISNMSKTINQRLHRPSYSLSSDENIKKEAESSSKGVFQTPENQFILRKISDSVVKSIYALNLGRKNKYISEVIQETMISGDFFFKKSIVVKKLKSIGLEKREINFLYQKCLVLVRSRLLEARENANAIVNTKIGKDIPSIFSGGDT